ncbi:MAG: sigma-54-dependent Fis family transcriptional regulator [Bdellovibrionaceae bacterium]|nr:sigma-54-dependent Fis family transcriptional regulator [Pseudobdellovibrionaceae bacterium]
MAEILLIEDDFDLAEMIQAFLKQKGHHCVHSEDPVTALQHIQSEKLKPELILTDLKMPRMSGIEILQQLKKNQINIPVIVITSNRSMETAVEAIHEGAFDYVVKPLNLAQILITLERALYLSRLQGENQTLKTALQIKEGTNLPDVKGKSPQFLKVLELAKRVASSTAHILVTGESGTGKEVIARTIHKLSARAKKPFVAINCSAIPEQLLESELFGHAKGSFTGAIDKKIGLFEEAEGGTLFLDEIGDLNLQLQAKLLRVLQEKKYRRVGENQQRDANVRVISATHKDLAEEVKKGNFREDLFFRLNVIPIKIPTLRERKEDILPLADFFLKKFSSLNGRDNLSFTKEAVQWLLSQHWKGNVRELENTIERAVVLCQGNQIPVEDLREFEAMETTKSPLDFLDTASADPTEVLTLDQITKNYIKLVLNKNNGAREKTAKDLAIDRKTLYRKIQEIEAEGQTVGAL